MDSFSRSIACSGPAGGPNPAAHAAGNLTKIDRSGTSYDWAFSYDSFSRQTCARQGSTCSGQGMITYVLDPLDRVLSRTKDSEVTSYSYRGISEVVSKTVAGSTTMTYAASASGTPLAQQKNGQGSSTRYFLSDPHGDLVALVSSSAAPKGTVSFDPWGQKLSTSGTETSVLGFQSDITDPDSGLVDMGTRHYVPSLGRFSTRDVLFGEPQNPTSLNMFAYGLASPVTFIDPTGMGSIAGNEPTQEDYESYGEYTTCKADGGADCSSGWRSGWTNRPDPFPPPAPLPSVTIKTPTTTINLSGVYFGGEISMSGWYEGPDLGMDASVGLGADGSIVLSVGDVSFSDKSALFELFKRQASGAYDGEGGANVASIGAHVRSSNYTVGVHFEDQDVAEWLLNRHKIRLDYSSSSEIRLPTGHIARVGVDVEMVFHDNGFPLIPAGGALVYAIWKVGNAGACVVYGSPPSCQVVTQP